MLKTQMRFFPSNILKFCAIALLIHIGSLALQGNASLKSSPSTLLEVKLFAVDVTYKGSRFKENMYLLFDQNSKHAVIIDPGATSSEMDAFIQLQGLVIKAILNTHGHYDHIGANHYYAKKYKVDVYGHPSDIELYEANKPNKFFDPSSSLRFGSITLDIIHTPGHTEGSICLSVGQLLFSGDTLFRESIGRTWGDTAAQRRAKSQQIINNIRTRLFPLADSTRVYPGHGKITTIGWERRNNPFLIPGPLKPRGF